MPNEWFNPTGNPVTRSIGLSSLVRNEIAAIGAAFDRLPDPVSSGGQGFQGGAWSGATLYSPSIQGGQVGSGALPALSVSSVAFLGAGTGYAAGALPAESGTFGAFFRMAGTNRVGYARTNSAGAKVTMFFDDTRNLVMGNAADENAVGATEGFLYIPTCNGAPTGAPTAYTGAVPIVYDRANNRIYVRSGGTWRQVTVA